MATRITRTVVDDLDGSDDAISTYRFALEELTFEIDLSDANRQRLREALTPFMSAGRRLPKNTHGRGTRSSATSEVVKRQRRWWSDNQDRDDLLEYRASGRIPQQVADAYQRAGAPQQP